MSKRNILAGLAAASALLVTPAFADGKDGTRINKGPEPLKARLCSDGSTGYYDAQGRFICQSTRVTTPRPTYSPPVRTYTPPTPQRISAPAPAAPKFDLTGMTGGVGANVGGGYYGGGGGFIFTDRGSFSGVLSHPAAALTFNRRRTGGTHRPMPRPTHPCGCGGMGGGMGGGD